MQGLNDYSLVHFSIDVPVRNRAKYVKKNVTILKEILKQSSMNFVVLDNISPNISERSTYEIRKYLKKDAISHKCI